MELIDLPAGHPAWDRAFPVLQELRSARTIPELRQVVSEGAEQGLRFLGAFDGQECLGIAGWRVIINTFERRKLYIDDLVTTEAARSSGVGALLVAELRRRAVDLGCFVLDLDSGVQRYAAHRFYFRERMAITAYHFTEQLPAGDP